MASFQPQARLRSYALCAEGGLSGLWCYQDLMSGCSFGESGRPVQWPLRQGLCCMGHPLPGVGRPVLLTVGFW